MAWEERATGVLAALALLGMFLAVAGPGAAPEILASLDPGSISENVDATFRMTIENDDAKDINIKDAFIVFPWEASKNLQFENANIPIKSKTVNRDIQWTTHVPGDYGGKSYKLIITLQVQESDGAGGWKFPQEYTVGESVFVSAPFSLTTGLGPLLIVVIVAVIVVIILAIIANRMANEKRARKLERKKMEDAIRERREKMVMGAEEGLGQSYGGPQGMGSGPMGQPQGQPLLARPPMGPPPGGPTPGGPPQGFGATPPGPWQPHPSAHAPVGPANVTCPSCNTMSDARAPSCWKCGTPLKK